MEATSVKCPGCGAQRAIHYLLNFDILSAAKQNLLLVLSIPYIATGVVFDSLKTRNKAYLTWRKRLFGRQAVYVILALIGIFWMLRNFN